MSQQNQTSEASCFQSGMSHTPGPWHTAGTFDPDQDPRQNIWSEARPGAVSGELVARHAKPANARLIAAAPELLDALQLFVKQWNACGPNSDFGRYFSSVRDTAETAIAKAGGK